MISTVFPSLAQRPSLWDSPLVPFCSLPANRVALGEFRLTGILVLLSLEDGRVGLSMLIFSLVVLVCIRALAIPQWKIVREQMAEFYGFVGEQFAGTEDIRANGTEGYALHRFLDLVRERLKP